MFVKGQGYKNGDKIDLKWDVEPMTIFDRLVYGFGLHFGSILAPKIDQKCMLKLDRFSDAFWEGSRCSSGDRLDSNRDLGCPGGG